MQHSCETEVLIIGGGIAGISTALRLADAGLHVTVLSKKRLRDAASFHAQGGIAAVLDSGDSLQSHVADTMAAGAGLCRPETVEHVVRHGPDCIRWLVEQGVSFTRGAQSNAFHLTREGGHSRRRVVHAADATGRAVIEVLEEKARRHPSIRLLEQQFGVDLITSSRLGLPGRNRCLGLYVLDKETESVETVGARAVVLATGGASEVYRFTTNPDTSTGDGIAMAWRAGCRVTDMEFVQFHPTCLYHPRARSFLISEAVRGEGGRLIRPDSTEFMNRYDPRRELAPRDIVARAIDSEIERHNLECVYVDISHKPAAFVRSCFPTIYERCKDFGFDMTREPLPVTPAAHYTCGGIATDLDGCTDIEGLYAIGECAFTGLHGANRLASNSLLEALVFARAASDHIPERLAEASFAAARLPPWNRRAATSRRKQVVISDRLESLRRIMWRDVGIVRTNERLHRAQQHLTALADGIRDLWNHRRVSHELLELRNLLEVAQLITRSAMQRQESRGLHYNCDYPDLAPRSAPTCLGVPPERSTRAA